MIANDFTIQWLYNIAKCILSYLNKWHSISSKLYKLIPYNLFSVTTYKYLLKRPNLIVSQCINSSCFFLVPLTNPFQHIFTFKVNYNKMPTGNTSSPIWPLTSKCDFDLWGMDQDFVCDAPTRNGGHLCQGIIHSIHKKTEIAEYR